MQKNKQKSSGDMHNNWEKNLISANPTMKKDHTAVSSAVQNWFRMHSNYILPDCVIDVCSEFYVEAKCGKCGSIGTDKEDKDLYLNLYDGFIGCSRTFNKCAIDHWDQSQQCMLINRKKNNLTYRKYNAYLQKMKYNIGNK
eukprot:199718_1